TGCIWRSSVTKMGIGYCDHLVCSYFLRSQPHLHENERAPYFGLFRSTTPRCRSVLMVASSDCSPRYGSRTSGSGNSRWGLEQGMSRSVLIIEAEVGLAREWLHDGFGHA